MNLGRRLVELTEASPFTGAGMSLVTALVALVVLCLLRKGGELSAQAAARATELHRALGEKIRRLFNLPY
jgi:hypothetical protein